jgi:hypothetical protein
MGVLRGFLVCLILAGLGFGAGGEWRLQQGENGTKVVATVSECHHVTGTHGGSTVCTGSWVSGGSLLNGGHVVLGTIDGAGSGDVGKDINVRLHGGTAYTRELRVPIILFCIGGLFLVFAVWLAWGMHTGSAYGPRTRAAMAAKSAG